MIRNYHYLSLVQFLNSPFFPVPYIGAEPGRPGSALYMGREKKESSGTGLHLSHYNYE